MRQSQVSYWLNGVVRTAEEVPHAYDHALHYGTGVFEGIRVYGGKAFALDLHLRRLLLSAERIGLRTGYAVSDLRGAVEALVSGMEAEEAYVRPIIWRGGPALGIHAPANAVNASVLAWEWPALFGARSQSLGISLSTDVPYRRFARDMFPVDAKTSAGYLTNVINRDHAVAAGFDDALQLDAGGDVAEGTGANVFMVSGDVLVTPPPLCFLNGITRQTVIRLARGMGMPVVERAVSRRDMEGADEVFLTGTAYEVLPVRQVDATVYPVGPKTLALQHEYFRCVRGGSGIAIEDGAYSL